MELPVNLRMIRRQSGISADEFAKYLGVSKWAYRAWERKTGNNDPSYSTLCKIAAMLDTTPNILLGFPVRESFFGRIVKLSDYKGPPSDPSEVFASNLKSARLREGFSLKGFAARLGISPNTYFNWEAGKHEPRYPMLCRICTELRTTPDDLFGFRLPDGKEPVKPLVKQKKGSRVKVSDFMSEDNGRYGAFPSNIDRNQPESNGSDNRIDFGMFRPVPCVRDQHGEIKKQTIKQLFAKIHEELIELEAAVYIQDFLDSSAETTGDTLNEYEKDHIASEAADLKTAVTTLEEAIGISSVMRDEAMQAVYLSNQKKGRL